MQLKKYNHFQLKLFIFVVTCFIISYVLFLSYQLQEPQEIKNRRQLLQKIKGSACSKQEVLQNMPSQNEYNYVNNRLKDIRKDNEFQKALETKDWDQYYGSLVEIYIGLIIFAILTFIIFVIQIIQVIYKEQCEFFSRNTEKEPYLDWSIYLSVSLAVLFSLLMIGTSISGIFIGQYIYPSANRAICQLSTQIDFLVEGKTDENWGSLQNIDQNFDTLYSNLQSSQSILISTFDNTDFLDHINDLQIQIDNGIYDKLKSLKVTLPNPNRVQKKQVSPDIIFKLGNPSITDTTKVVGSLKYEYETKILIMTDYLSKLKESSITLGNNVNQIINLLKNSQANMQGFQTQFSKLQENTNDLGITLQQYSFLVRNFTYAICSLSLIFCFFGLLGLLCVLYYKILWMKYLIYFAWFGITIISIIAWTMAFLSFAPTIVTYEICDALDQFLNNQQSFSKMNAILPSPEISACFYSDGDITSAFNINKQLKMIQEVNSDMINLYRFDYLFNDDQRQIDYWLAEVDSYLKYEQQGVQLSSVEGQDFYDLPDNTLHKLNSWSDFDYLLLNQASDQYISNCGPITRDKIVYRLDDCDILNQPSTFKSLIGQSVCIHLKNNATQIYDDTFIQNRLNFINQISCTGLNQIKDNYLLYFKSIKNYITEFEDIVGQKVLSELTKYQALNIQALDKLKQLYQKTQSTYKLQTNDLLKSVSNQENGLFASLNCSFFKQSVKQIRTNICQSFMVRIYNVSVILILISVFSFVTSLSFFFSTTRAVFYITKNYNFLNSSRQKEFGTENQAIDEDFKFQQQIKNDPKKLFKQIDQNESNQIELSKLDIKNNMTQDEIRFAMHHENHK